MIEGEIIRDLNICPECGEPIWGTEFYEDKRAYCATCIEERTKWGVKMNKVICPDCGEQRVVTSIHKNKLGFTQRCRKCWCKSKRGVSSPWYKRGSYITKEGYKLIRVYPESFFYPMADNNGYVRENRLAMAMNLGRNLQKWESVHHKDGNKLNNALSNLELTNKNQHMRDHNRGYKNGFAKGLKDGKKEATKKW